MRKLTILVDVDEVCADLLDEWLRRYRVRTGHMVYPSDLTQWDMRKNCPEWFIGYNGERGDIYSILQEQSLYEYVKPIEGSLDAINKIRAAGHRVIYVTSCVVGQYDAKLRWLVRHNFLPDSPDATKDYIPTTDKAMIRGDVLIDDHVKNVEAFPGYALLYTHPHNAALETSRERISSLSEALDKIETAFGGKLKDGIKPYERKATIKIVPPEGNSESRVTALPCEGELPKGKYDFDGTIDGKGYKRSFDDPSKPPIDLIPPTFIYGVARVLGKGAQKYARGNWMRGMTWSGVLAAIGRHLQALIEGEDIDPDSGENHLYHIGCEAAFLSWFMEGPRKAEYKQFDDRLFAVTTHTTTKEE